MGFADITEELEKLSVRLVALRGHL